MSFQTAGNPDDETVIREVVPGITTISVPFLRFNRIKFGGRATLVRLQSGTLAVFSPTPLTPLVKSTIASISPSPTPISYIIAPDLEHHMNLSAWHAAYPTAHIIAPEGLAEKRAALNRSDKAVTIVPFGTVFTARDKLSTKVTAEFDAEFAYEFVDAHPNKELVFVHRPSRTCIEADLLFNLPAVEQYSRSGIDPTTGWATRLFAAMQHTRGDALWQKRMLWYLFSKRDRAGFAESAKRINAWDFVNLVPCHGDTFVGDGKTVYEKVMEWHLQGKKKN
ncbi:uncharacterized protein L3040_008349 [Drepanopeziza brunnea f. sp. 'multigermtubi']|uniref:uncharacterized protein n=1 Tax=Drepanopeziza brunnea f. sp. 'multigermtubi' TaxID=698441 RepID=UPI0023930ECF|nr:hypothetical protein L3040_008349 [Drepanopeziza brunnea f. sp. 'multigermtubi']